MENKSERKRKLEQQRLILIHRIKEIDKHQDELLLKSLLLDVRKEELQLKSQALEQLINQMVAESRMAIQRVKGPLKMMPDPITLFMN